MVIIHISFYYDPDFIPTSVTYHLKATKTQDLHINSCVKAVEERLHQTIYGILQQGAIHFLSTRCPPPH